MVETLIYIALVSGIVLAATSFAWNIIDSRAKSYAIHEVEQNGHYCMEKITQVIRQATAIQQPAAGAAQDRLVLATDNPSTNPTTIAFTGDTITIQEGSQEPLVLLADTVKAEEVVFTNMSSAGGRSQHIRFRLGLEHDNPQGRQSWEFNDSFTTSVELRNIY